MRRVRYPTLANDKQLAVAVNALAEHCAIMRAIKVRTGVPPLREFSPDFTGLAKIVTGQQVSAASAAAIWARVAAGVRPFDAATVLVMPDDALASLGLSSAKIRTLKAVATSITMDGFDIAALADASDADVIEQLTSLHGIGPWTAESFLLFALRRSDAFPAGDLALQLSVQRLLTLKARPASADLLTIAERWRPWRGAAARLLWADYALRRRRAAMLEKPAKTRSR